MRQLLAATFLLLAAAADAVSTLHLPTSPGAFAVAVVDHGDHTVELREPVEYTFTPPFPDGAGSSFGRSGDLSGSLALIGAPAAWWNGIAFLYDANTGETLHGLEAGENLSGGQARPQFGQDVLLWQGLAIVSAPLAGDDFGTGIGVDLGPGAVFVFNATTGQKVQSIWGPASHRHMGLSLENISGGVYAEAINRATGARQYIELAIVPEPDDAVGLDGHCGWLDEGPNNETLRPLADGVLSIHAKA
jgi:hypothetical protein